jgi:hypothetical protein
MSLYNFIFLDYGVMDYIFYHNMPWQNNMSWKKMFFLLFFNFVDKNVLTPFEHDVHVYVFTIMYVFLIVFVQDTLKHPSIKDWTQDLMETCSSIHHGVHFLNCICTKYIKACIHQGLNPRPHGNIRRP